MKLDWTVSVGVLLHLVGMLIAVVGIYYKLAGQIREVQLAHTAEAIDIAEVRADLAELRKDIIGTLERRIRSLEITQAALTVDRKWIERSDI